jgi:WD40 repeat protein
MALTGSEDRTARLWAVPSGELFGDPLYHGDEGQGLVNSLAFRPDGRAVLTGCGPFARLWTLGAPTRPTPTAQAGPEQFLKRPTHVAHSPDLKLMLLIGEKGAQVRDADTRQAVGNPLPTKYPVSSVAWSPDGAMLLTGGSDGTAQVWSARTRVPIGQPMVHQGPIHSVRFSPDSRTVVTASADRSARFWDSLTGKPIGPPLVHKAPVTAVDFSPAGDAILTRTADGKVWSWERDPEPTGPDERFILWAHVVTGAQLDASDVIEGLKPSIWQQRRERLHAIGGPLPLGNDPRTENP